MYTNEGPGMRGCYTTYRPISIVTRASVMQIETRVGRGGFLHDVRHPSFSESRRKRRPMLDVDSLDPRPLHCSLFCDLIVIIVVAWICLLDIFFYSKG